MSRACHCGAVSLYHLHLPDSSHVPLKQARRILEGGCQGTVPPFGGGSALSVRGWTSGYLCPMFPNTRPPTWGLGREPRLSAANSLHPLSSPNLGEVGTLHEMVPGGPLSGGPALQVTPAPGGLRGAETPVPQNLLSCECHREAVGTTACPGCRHVLHAGRWRSSTAPSVARLGEGWLWPCRCGLEP